jgi:D-alanine transaminase
MSRIVYVNGAFVAEENAVISVFDRGFLFADAVYEVSTVLDGKLVDNLAHMERLKRSLGELKMSAPVPVDDIPALMEDLVARNDLSEGMVYLQVSRGAADRDFAFPAEEKPSLVMFTQAKAVAVTPKSESGIKIVSMPDQRWARRDIKTTQLLAQSVAKQEAAIQGADDAWMVEDGFVTEGSSNNAFIITADGVIVTRQLSNSILHGITRRVVLEIAEAEGLTVEQRPFTLAEAQAAAEAFSTSASSFVMPVVAIDGKTISQGVPGPITRKLRERYIALAKEAA